jgi:hypothetical protein
LTAALFTLHKDYSILEVISNGQKNRQHLTSIQITTNAGVLSAKKEEKGETQRQEFLTNSG